MFLVGLKNSSEPFGLYLMVLAFFHASEFVVTGLSNPRNLSWDSFLVNHSVAYWAAMLASWLEHGAWLWWGGAGAGAGAGLVTWLGLLCCLLGEALRKTAMLQAGPSFNHLVQSHKAADHQLVTGGVYAWCRHPSYVGWFLWSVGTQLVLGNPVCFLLYGWASFAFFKERIYIEEYTLISFFGSRYREYQAKVATGIPGIPGYHGPSTWGETHQ